MRTASLLALTAVTVFLVACGQKGPLVLPDAQHPHKKLGLPKPVASPAAPGAPAGSAPPTPAAPAPPAPAPPAPGHTDDDGNAGDAGPAPAPQQ